MAREQKKDNKPKNAKASADKAVKATTKGPNVKYLIVRSVTHNILGNARYVMEACKCKTLMAAHLKAVSMIQATIAKNNIGALPKAAKGALAPKAAPKPPKVPASGRGQKQSGGDPVLPSEYFGIDSGKYMDISEASKLETNMFADSTLSRAEMPIKMGGGNSAEGAKYATIEQVKKAAKELSVRVSAEAAEMIRLSAEQHVREIMKLTKDMSLESVRQVIATNFKLSYLNV